MLACWILMLRLGASGAVPDGGYLYRATLLQAAPGKLVEVLDLLKAGWPGVDGGGDEAPLVMRHSQGDRWGLSAAGVRFANGGRESLLPGPTAPLLP